MKKIILLAMLAFTTIGAYSQDNIIHPSTPSKNTIFSSAPLKTPPIIDGIITTEEYTNASKISGGGRVTDDRQLEVWVGYDIQNLYFAIKSELPPGGDLLSKARVSADVLTDDSVEILIYPPKGRKPGSFQFGYFQLIVNPEGLTWSKHHEPGWGLSSELWKPDITQKSRMTKDGFWEIELSMPLKQMGWDEMPLPSQWKMIVARNFQYPLHQAAFTPATFFNKPDMMATLICSKDLPSVHHSFPKWDKIRGAATELNIFNPTNETIKLTANLSYNQKQTENKEFSIPPKGSTSLNIKMDGSSSNYEFHGEILKGKTTIFNRDAVFKTPKARSWTNLESYLKFRAPISDKPEGGILIENDKPLRYKDSNLAIPTAVVLKFKPETQLKGKMKRIFFKSDGSKEGHLYLYENEKYLLLGFQYFPWQEGSSTQQIVMVKTQDTLKGWQNVVINLEAKKATLYMNGILVGSTAFGTSIEGQNLGDILIGVKHMENNFKIAKVETYDRILSGDEIAKMGLGKAGFGGEISYFPSLSELVVEAEANPYLLPKNPQISLLITDTSRKVIKEVDYTLEKDFAPLSYGNIILRRRVKLPELADGEYYTYLKLKDPNGSSGAFLGKTFVVKKYEWANNKIGLSKTIVPPFTPLEVEGKEVKAILKRYIIADNGFPEKIIAKGESILSDPIKGILAVEGKIYPWSNSSVNFTDEDEDTVKYIAESENELFKMKTLGEFDYDGMLKLTLQLVPKKTKKKIDNFYIDIPVKESIAKLFHAAGSGNRSNPAGYIPDGEGLIWGCRSIPHVLPNFIPYIWVGGAEKGICYAADWDKDWIHSTNSKEHAVELHRSNDGSISIRLNLINHAPLAREREIVFTLLATPVKPMPKDWRAWSDNYANFKFPGRKFMQALYTGMYFGMPFGWSGRYPAFKDYDIIQKLDETRKTGVIDKNFLDDYVNRLDAASVKDVPAKEKGKEHMKIMLQCGFNHMKSLSVQKKDTLVYYYTCCYEQAKLLPEFPVYKNEWEYRTKMSPVKSWRDYAIYYDAKMIDAGFDGIYLDNTAFAAKWCWPTGDGYIDDENNIKPSFGLWRMRNYIKRLATMFAEKNKDPFIFAHVTNSLSLTSFSFATATMDLEWKYGDKDYQDRYSADYLLAMDAGRQGGFFPTAIDGIVSKPDEKVWITRTMLASLLPHEIQPTIGIGDGSDLQTMRNVYQIIWDFGKAEPDSRFIGYWEKDTPIVPQGGNLIASAYIRGNKILLVIGNYGNEAKIPIKIDCSKLGFKSVTNAINKETGKSLVLKNADTLLLKINKHDLALIEVHLE